MTRSQRRTGTLETENDRNATRKTGVRGIWNTPLGSVWTPENANADVIAPHQLGDVRVALHF